jgi:hypothetical protein
MYGISEVDPARVLTLLPARKPPSEGALIQMAIRESRSQASAVLRFRAKIDEVQCRLERIRIFYGA